MKDSQPLILAVLHNVTDNSEFIKVSTPAFCSERLLERYLDIINVTTVPDLAKQDVGEAECHQIFDHFLAEVVVNAIYLVTSYLGLV
jgi:hypothetical protein